MTRSQRLALAGSLTLLVVLGLFAAYLLGTGSGDSTAGSSTPGSSAPSSAVSEGPPSSQPLPPMTIDGVQITSGPLGSGGWGTDVNLIVAGPDGPQISVVHGNGEGEYDVTFDRQITIHQSALDEVAAAASRMLMRLTWDQANQQLQIFQTAFTSNITAATTASAGGKATVEFVRTPLPPTRDDCIEIDKPVPYTALVGLSKAAGFADLFEGGPMTVVARVPGKGQRSIKVKTAAGRQPFSADLRLPLLDAPAEGYVAAFDYSAKDGSPICLVKIPVYMSPGG